MFLYAFDVLELNGEDLRREPLEARKRRLAKALSRAKDGILLNEHIEHHGELVFEHACKLGLEGIIAKRIGVPYRSGRCKSWPWRAFPCVPLTARVANPRRPVPGD